jgi:hypothetical protein
MNAIRDTWKVVVATGCALALCASTLSAQAQATFLYSLANFLGPLRYDWVRVSVDPQRDETYVIYQNLVRIFNPSGMEVFSFGDDLDLGQILDAAADRNGDIILLSYKNSGPLVTRCNFRGVPIGRIEITNLPAGRVFNANRMILRNGTFYFASDTASTVVITDIAGKCRQFLELTRLLGDEDVEKAGAEMSGFSVDQDGNILFTMPVMFKAYKYSPDGTLKWFGKPGSSPGRFGIVAGIVTDSRGNVLVADKLRSVVMVFDKDFNFLTEFGYRGTRPENLFTPDGLAIDPRDHLYVSQGRRRGISVFALARQ